jgi:hypothetical protein
MLKITIDHNNDLISFEKDGKANGEMKLKYPYQFQQVLVEILDRIDNLSDVSIEEIDEDNRRLVDEW